VAVVVVVVVVPEVLRVLVAAAVLAAAVLDVLGRGAVCEEGVGGRECGGRGF
jgi:hypothetical protein